MFSSTPSSVVLLAMAVTLLLMTSQSKAWSQWTDDDNDNWGLRSCAKTDQACTRSVKCCNSNDICITSAKRDSSGARTGYCTRLDSLRTFEAKSSIEPCSSSQECIDGCCREYRKHRVGKIYVCGTPRNAYTTFRCI